MTPLNLPSYAVRVRQSNGRNTIFDPLRRRYVTLTPEEWVRQHFINFLIAYKHYPASLLANELQLKVGSKSMRADTVLYDATLQPRMIIEYKAPTVAITQRVFDQIVTYNLLLHVDYLVVSNGINHYICRMDYEHQSYEFLPEIPDYQKL